MQSQGRHARCLARPILASIKLQKDGKSGGEGYESTYSMYYRTEASLEA
jgi:hypothetical protein